MTSKKIALVAAVTLACVAAQAQTWPDRPITLVVPSSPGGSTDLSARLIGEPLSKALGQPIVIDNKAGAAGNLGTEAVARAKPDGYTLLMQYSGYHVGNPALFPQIRWSPRDFVPVALVMRAPHVIAVSGAIPVSNLQEFIALGKKNGKGLFYASSGNGSIQHIAGELFEQQAKVPLTHVPYKGAGPAVNDLLGGQVDMFVTTPPSVIGHIASGKLKALAYTGKQRHPSLANVPTSAEAGLPGYEVDSWFAVFAPAGTPAPVVARLSAEIKTIVESETYRKKVNDQGAFATYMDPKALGSFVQSELDLWAGVIKAKNIQAD
ncbi:extra-cytoplasmic solute receptor [Sphaerotilus natans subsp. natans DSM 6575]|jgi:tripartite-type tricarboxylate transporter receptor subunit TctC|uniref:Extra-cytoplasmic solute receptor n=1 Tax=Sphaerotilus natans subsp. natans DSM 6575 TaxID=1286631 RepID=A0A059KSL9_9BURK|nr:tripartite tricarboxylate transporter substrate binding protein [Sphaerotilus natans]KDB54365.1 extra-cytoplasmic solute receptor [Sphaerotilus natans subsp. natans DSM 6575]SIR94388.1 Tripartite-type tricarboxylate transporter, receptor component TctC [Sphaerotilus natans]